MQHRFAFTSAIHSQAPSVQYARTVAAECVILFAMRKCRTVETGRCYHLISRLAHRAFFLDDDEKTRAVDLMRRVEEFGGILILAYVYGQGFDP